ncbi:hypothetical protein NBRC116188_25160 [Oceaniserpentilla sp. 4NH20-0058]
MINSIGTLNANVLKYEFNLDKIDTTIHFTDLYTSSVDQICTDKARISHYPR